MAKRITIVIVGMVGLTAVGLLLAQEGPQGQGGGFSVSMKKHDLK